MSFNALRAPSNNANPYSDKMVKADIENKSKVIKDIKAKKAEGMANIYSALKRAFEIATGAKAESGVSVWKNENANIFSDTFYLLTDSIPNTGALTDTDKIIKQIDEWNSGLNIRIHTIGFGFIDEETHKYLMKIAKHNSGRFNIYDYDKD